MEKTTEKEKACSATGYVCSDCEAGTFSGTGASSCTACGRLCRCSNCKEEERKAIRAIDTAAEQEEDTDWMGDRTDDGQMTEQEENLQALRVLDTAADLLQKAELHARLQGEAERELSVLQCAISGEATQCQSGTDWEEILHEALVVAEFKGEEAKMGVWLASYKVTYDEGVWQGIDKRAWNIIWNDIERGCPYPWDPRFREAFWSSPGGRLFDAAVNIAKTVARAQAQSARVTTEAAPVTNNNGFAMLAAPYDEEERGQSGTEAFMLRLDKATEKTKVTRPNACPSAATDDPDHEDWVAGLQRELAVLRTQAQPPEKSTFETVESLQALRTRARHTDAQADSNDAKAGILSCVGDNRTAKLIAIQLETEHLLHACAQAWKLLPAISPRTHEDGDGDVRMGEDGDVHMGEDGEYCWNSISCEQLRQILESPRNGIWYEAKAWVTTRTARFTALTSSLDADDAFTVIPKKNSKTAKKGSGESATGDSLDSAFATLAQINEDFAVQRSKITQTYKAWMNQAHDRSSNQHVSNRKR